MPMGIKERIIFESFQIESDCVMRIVLEAKPPSDEYEVLERGV